MTDLGTIAAYATPILTTIGGYFVGKRKRNNDFLSDLQKSIDLLSAKNAELMADVVKLRSQNADLVFRLEILQRQNDTMAKEIEDLNAKLENVKTITRTK